MVLKRYCKDIVKENSSNSKRRQDSGVHYCRKINKGQKDSDIKTTQMDTNINGKTSKDASKRYMRKDENDDDDDDDDMSVGSTCDDAMESSDESMNEDGETSLSELETEQVSTRTKIDSKKKKPDERNNKKKKSPQEKVKNSKIQIRDEPMNVSEDEEERMMQEELRKYRPSHRCISKQELAKYAAGLKNKKKGLLRKMGKKSKKTKSMSKSMKKKIWKKKRKNRYSSDEEIHIPPKKVICETPGNGMEKKLSKQDLQNENKGGINTSKYNTDSAEKKGTSIDDARNLNTEKPVAEEKKTPPVPINKGPTHVEIAAKVSKENEKNDGNKVNKAKEKVEDISKKVDQKEVKDMDEEVAMIRPNTRATRFNKSKHPSKKMMRLSSGKSPKKVPPFIKFSMRVYRELCDTCSNRAIAKEAARRWKGMTAEERKTF